VERIGYLKEVVVERIGRIYPISEVKRYGYKTDDKAGKER